MAEEPVSVSCGGKIRSAASCGRLFGTDVPCRGGLSAGSGTLIGITAKLRCAHGKEEDSFCFSGVLCDRSADGRPETRFPGLLCGRCRAGFRRRMAGRRVARADARQHRRRVCHRTAAAADPCVAVGAAARENMAAGADRLFRVSRNRHGGHLRCRCRVIPALGLPPRCDDPDLPYRPRGGYGERRFLARGAPDPAGRRLRGAHGLGLPPRLPPVRRGAAPPACGAAVEPCPAAARRVRFPRHPRRAGGFGRQCVEGLFQCEHVSESCGDQPGLFVPHEPRRSYRLCRRIPLLRRGRTRGTVCPLAREQPFRRRSRAGADDPAPQCRGGYSRKFRPYGHGCRCRRSARHAQHAAPEGRRHLVRKFLRQLVPHRPGRGGYPERIPCPDPHVDHEAPGQEP